MQRSSLFPRTVLVTLVVGTMFVRFPSAADTADQQFEQRVQPLLKMHCLRCHGTATKKGGLDLSSPAAMLAGSDSGPVLVPGKPEKSLLWQMVESREMPPDKSTTLSNDELATMRRWIESGSTASSGSTSQPLSQQDIAPILLRHCAPCHGRQQRDGNFDVRTHASLLAGGKSGPAIVPAKPEESRLIQRIVAGEMPPKQQLAAFSVKPVESADLQKLRDWIAQGALQLDRPIDVPNGEPDPLVSDDDRKFWSFQPPHPVALPAAIDQRSRNAIDAFIAERLRTAGLSMAPAVDRATLLRRVYFDLHGLPPEPAVAERFLEDQHPLAYERLVDELLASPRYGERWGQYWLDLAGYSDSEGIQDSDLIRPQAYRYRDYVIRSMNLDKPYDRWLQEQLAGDELADYEHAPTITPELYDNLVATGFLRMSADGTFAGITGFLPDRLDVVDDQLKILGSAVMGLTIGCARCHSHKFDPLPQRDYYRLAAVFKGALDEYDWLKPTRQDGPPGTKDRYLPYVMADERAAWESGDKEIQTQLEALKKQLEEVKDDSAKKKELQARIKEVESRRQPEPMIRALWDRGEPSPTYVLHRGDYLSPARLVGPAPPAVLMDGRTPFVAQPPWPGARQTGLRLALARWLTQPDQPLTARVIVNRVWKLHCGEGLVRTLDNFGHTGERPTHPELLDWLARELVRREWSLKSLHRLVVTSETYRQASSVSAEQLRLDPENRLVSRMPLRRLDAESLGDTLLLLADRLNLRMYGTGDALTSRPDGLVTPTEQSGARRRSIYVLQRRTQPLTLLADFDRPAMSPNCVARPESTVAPQALHLLNNRMVRELSDFFADRIIAEAGPEIDAQVDRVSRWACGRPPTPEEAAQARQSLLALRRIWETQPPPAAAGSGESTPPDIQRRALGNYCHAIMNSAALLFVD